MKQFEIDVHKSASITQRVKEPRRAGDIADDQHQPTVLYNGMIAPIVPYTIKGVIWYQGESIIKGIDTYAQVQETLIKDWRAKWNNPELPFYVVQLAGFSGNKPEVREAQAAALKMPHVGVAVTMDIGDRMTVHPTDKQSVGDRLSRIALADAYGKQIEYSGPVYESMAVEDKSIRVKFTHIDKGLLTAKPLPAAPAPPAASVAVAADAGAAPAGRGRGRGAADGAAAAAGLGRGRGGRGRGGPPPVDLSAFEIAGADGHFVPAVAKIDGQSVVVSSLEVPEPKNVRYAWEPYSERASFYNTAGLPAMPFRTGSK